MNLSMLLPAAILAAIFAQGAAARPSPQHFTVCGSAGDCGRVLPVDDDQLAHVAGKYTIAGEVVGMSLTMTSSWQSSNGQRLEAAGGVTISLPGSGRTSAGVHAQASGNGSTSSGSSGTPRQVYMGEGLRSVNGVTQVIQVAGDGNVAANRSAIQVSYEPQNFLHGNGQSQASYGADNGARADVSIDSNGVMMTLSLPDGSAARQRINMAGTGQVHQGIQIAGDGHSVTNALQLQLQMQQLGRAAAGAQGLHRSLDMLRGR